MHANAIFTVTINAWADAKFASFWYYLREMKGLVNAHIHKNHEVAVELFSFQHELKMSKSYVTINGMVHVTPYNKNQRGELSYNFLPRVGSRQIVREWMSGS